MTKPRVRLKCPAAPFAGPAERIIEFSSGRGDAAGGLIAFRNLDAGDLLVNVYRATGCDVRVDYDDKPERSTARVLDMLDNVSAALETVLGQFGGAMFPADAIQRRKICAEARAFCDSILRPVSAQTDESDD